MVVQQLWSLKLERPVLLYPTTQAAAPEEAGSVLEDLAWPLLPPENHCDDDRTLRDREQVLERVWLFLK